MNSLLLAFQPIAQDQDYQTLSATANTNNQRVARVVTRIGSQPWLVALRNSVDAAGLGKVRFKTQINGSYAPPPYDFSFSQWAAPEADVWLPVPIQLPQGCTVDIVVDNTDVSIAYNATARIIVVYQSIADALAKAGY